MRRTAALAGEPASAAAHRRRYCLCADASRDRDADGLPVSLLAAAESPVQLSGFAASGGRNRSGAGYFFVSRRAFTGLLSSDMRLRSGGNESGGPVAFPTASCYRCLSVWSPLRPDRRRISLSGLLLSLWGGSVGRQLPDEFDAPAVSAGG